MDAAVRDRQPASAFAPGTRIAYAPDLVARLVDEHQSLLVTFARLQAAVHDREIVVLKKIMGDFSNHILLENVKLYIFLQRRLSAEPSHTALARKFRKEMGGIAVEVMDFVGHYQAMTFWTNGVWATLADDLNALGAVLVNRIAEEERLLYPLYQPIQD